MYHFEQLLTELAHADLPVRRNTESQKNTYHSANIAIDDMTPQPHVLYICEHSAPEALLQSQYSGCLFACGVSLPETALCETVLWDDDTPPQRLLYLVQSALSSVQNKNFIQSLAYDSLLQKQSVQDFIREVYGVFGNPIALHDAAYNVVAIESGGAFVRDKFYQYAREYGRSSEESIRVFQEDGISELIEKTDGPVLWDFGYANQIPRIAQKIVSPAGETIAMLAIHQCFRPFLAQDFENVDALCKALSVKMRYNQHIGTLQMRRENLLRTLLCGAAADGAQEAEWKDAFSGYNLFQMGFIETALNKGMLHQLEYLRAVLTDGNQDLLTVRYQNNLALLLCFSDKEQKQKLREDLCIRLKNQHLRLGVSTEFTSFTDVAAQYRRAADALHLGSKYGDAQATVLRFSDLLPYHLLHHIDTETLRRCYQASAHRQLAVHDSQKETDYCETMRQYIRFLGNSTRAAQALFIHKNTMLYRLARISELCNIDLTNGSDLISFSIADILFQYLKAQNTEV